MKKLLFTAALFWAATGANAQKYIQLPDGNWIQQKGTIEAHDSTTTQTFTDSEGMRHPIYKGRKGGLYIIRRSKKGNYYRQYLTAPEK